MSQHDFQIANDAGAAVRADINDALQALASTSKGSTAPGTPYSGQLWWDTGNDKIKIRNAANDSWVDFAYYDGTTLRPLYEGGDVVPAGAASATDSGTDAFQFNLGRDAVDGEIYLLDFGSASTTTSPTGENTGGSPSGGKSIVNWDGSALWAGAINGLHLVQFDGTNTRWLLVNPRADVNATGNSPMARDASGGTVVTALNDGPLAGFRNAVINGQFDVWQRGTSFTDPGFAYTADRWGAHVRSGDGGAGTISRQEFAEGQTAVPSQPTYYLRFNQSAAPASALPYLAQLIELVRTFNGDKVVVSFWAKADASISVDLQYRQYFGSGAGASAAVGPTDFATKSIGTSWAKFEATLDVPSISGNTIDGGDDFLEFRFELPSSTFTLDITNVQVELGSVATPFERRTYESELRACERYFVRRYFAGAGRSEATNNEGRVVWNLPTPMRTNNPTFTLNNNPEVEWNASNFNTTTIASAGVQGSATESVAVTVSFTGSTDANDFTQTDGAVVVIRPIDMALDAEL